MSAATRLPARTSVVARHYLGMLGRETALKGIGLAVAASLWTSTNTAEQFAAMEACLPLTAFLPLLQWRGGGKGLEPALPLGGVRHDLVRVACGLAWAAATLVLPAMLWGLGARLSLYPWWYPLLMVAAGLGYYLLGSAIWLRTVRPGRVLVILLLLVPALWEALGLGPNVWTVVYASREELRGVGAAQWIVSAAAWLGTGCAAVGLAAVAGRRGGHAERGTARAAWSASLPARRGAMRRGPRPAPGLPPRPASALTALREQASLMRHRMAWPTVITLLVTLTDARAEMRLPPDAQAPIFLQGASSLVGLGVVAFLWPLLVWMDEHGAGREHEAALPVGVVTRRLARVAAGGAGLAALCLIVMAGPAAGAWIAGTLPSPAAIPARVWAGIPIAALMLYLAGSIPLLLSPERPLRRVLGWFLVTFIVVLPLIWNSGVGDARFSPTAALSVLTTHPVPWTAAALLWLAMLAAAATCAAAVGASQDRGWPWPWSADPTGRAA